MLKVMTILIRQAAPTIRELRNWKRSCSEKPIRRADQAQARSIELKIFGKSHAGEDLADRVDRIAQYADKKFNGNQNTAFTQNEPRNGSIEQKVAWLETQIEESSLSAKTNDRALAPSRTGNVSHRSDRYSCVHSRTSKYAHERCRASAQTASRSGVSRSGIEHCTADSSSAATTKTVGLCAAK